MEKVRIPVTVGTGLFSGEYAINVTLFNGSNVSFFLEKYLVEEKDGEFFIEAFLYETDEQAGKMRVFLPRATFETCSAHAEIPIPQC